MTPFIVLTCLVVLPFIILGLTIKAIEFFAEGKRPHNTYYQPLEKKDEPHGFVYSNPGWTVKTKTNEHGKKYEAYVHDYEAYVHDPYATGWSYPLNMRRD